MNAFCPSGLFNGCFLQGARPHPWHPPSGYHNTLGPWEVGSRAARPGFRSDFSNLSFPICKIGQIQQLPSWVVRGIPELWGTAPQPRACAGAPHRAAPMELLPLLPSLFHRHNTAASQCTAPSGFWSVFALTLETMVQPSGRAHTPPPWVCEGLCAGDTAEMPQAGMSWPRRGGGLLGAGGGQLVPDLFKGQRFSTPVRGRGVSGRPAPPEHTPPGEGVVQIRDSATPPLQPSTGAPEGPLFLWERGAAPPSPDGPPGAAPLPLPEAAPP